MINFIICEDNGIILQKNIDIINKTMFNNNLNYRIYPFKNYDEELQNVINAKEEFKIYILDIELEDKSGIEIAREIRKNDFKSFIVISTAHTEYLPYTLKSKLLIFDFISKFDEYEKNMQRVINHILNEIPNTKMLQIKIGSDLININFDDIISLQYNNKIRKTIIKTKKEEYKVNKPLVSFVKELDERFQKKDNCIINTTIINNISI